MSVAKQRYQEQPCEIPAKSKNRFLFPQNSHLLVTTPSQICAWDSSGIRTVFQSKKSGIVAAREAQDGSGILAVADTHVVVLHDTKRGREESWGLEADGDEVRHLEYTADAKSLFLSTNLTSDIQRYSSERAKLLNPTRAHASPPVALAISSTGHLMVSASDSPPVVYLKNLAHDTAPVLVEPRASKAAVSVAAFHPERPNIFLLAFRDGIIAAYDATRVMRSRGGSVTNQESVNSGEISHLSALHRAAPIENKRAAITGAAFLPGFKTRAISVGGDGRCRIVDFADGGVILRTWHAKAPVTCVSVLSLKRGSESRSRSASSAASHVIGGPTSTNNLIAMGRSDGQVHLYDSVGLLLSQQNVSPNAEKIISVEWATGASPKPILDSSIGNITPDLSHVPTDSGKKAFQEVQLPKSPPTRAQSQNKPRRASLFEHVGLPPELRRPKSPTPKSITTAPTRKFTIHPDEVEEGTVRHTPLEECSKPKPVAQASYLDLFSPVKPAEAKPTEPIEKRLGSPPRSRPALTSQTFVKSPAPVPTNRHDTMTRRRNLALFPSTDSGRETARPSAVTDTKVVEQKDASKTSLQGPKKHITFKEDALRPKRKSSSFKTSSAPLDGNAKVLAELRKMSSVHPAHRSGGTLSIFGPLKVGNQHTSPAPGKKDTKTHPFRWSASHVETELDSDTARKAFAHAHEKRHWPEDSTQEPSLDGDIWLTSESDATTQQSRKRKPQHVPRPPARQTSRSRVTSKGTTSTLAQQPADVASASAQRLHKLDGSTEDDMFTAGTHFTSTGSFSPSSKDVRELFPRSSSLSPRKGRKSKKPSQHSPGTVDRNLREVKPNEAAGRIPKSPWARAKAGKMSKSGSNKSTTNPTPETIQVLRDNGFDTNEQKENVTELHCRICESTKARVNELEAEVARLRGEVLVLKAVCRRQGLPVPSSVRGR